MTAGLILWGITVLIFALIAYEAVRLLRRFTRKAPRPLLFEERVAAGEFEERPRSADLPERLRMHDPDAPVARVTRGNLRRDDRYKWEFPGNGNEEEKDLGNS